MRGIRSWAPLFIKTLVTTATTIISNDWSFCTGTKTAGIASEVIDKFYPITEVPYEKHMTLLANMQKDIINCAELRKIYSPPQYLP